LHTTGRSRGLAGGGGDTKKMGFVPLAQMCSKVGGEKENQTFRFLPPRDMATEKKAKDTLWWGKIIRSGGNTKSDKITRRTARTSTPQNQG